MRTRTGSNSSRRSSKRRAASALNAGSDPRPGPAGHHRRTGLWRPRCRRGRTAAQAWVPRLRPTIREAPGPPGPDDHLHSDTSSPPEERALRTRARGTTGPAHFPRRRRGMGRADRPRRGRRSTPPVGGSPPRSRSPSRTRTAGLRASTEPGDRVGPGSDRTRPRDSPSGTPIVHRTTARGRPRQPSPAPRDPHRGPRCRQRDPHRPRRAVPTPSRHCRRSRTQRARDRATQPERRACRPPIAVISKGRSTARWLPARRWTDPSLGHDDPCVAAVPPHSRRSRVLEFDTQLHLDTTSQIHDVQGA
jgi:hypothetical protein